jgi:hypothetical protein
MSYRVPIHGLGSDGERIEAEQDDHTPLRALAQRIVNALGEQAAGLSRTALYDQLRRAGLATGDDRADDDAAAFVESHIRWLLYPTT